MPHSLSRRTFLRLSGLGLGSAILAACAPPVPEPGTDAPEQAAVTLPPAPATATAVSPENLPEAADRPFAATDPGSVQLAAGRPQLVEFFAFW